MTVLEFTQKVVAMRDAQKTYFRTRKLLDLRIARSLEIEVDRLTEDFLKNVKNALRMMQNWRYVLMHLLMRKVISFLLWK